MISWPAHKKKLLNLIMVLSLNKIDKEEEKDVFCSSCNIHCKNIDEEELINKMNGEDSGYECYLKAL